MADELEQYLATLERDQGYRVERVLKTGDSETTEVVVADEGPYSGKPLIRKRFKAESGLGSAYTRIWEAQQQGATFLHVPRIVDFYSTCRELVVVSEYASGETLTDVIYRLDPSIELAVDVFPRLCDAVAELHECFDSPLIHRDLKPSNIVLSYGALKLIDFGIARSYTEGADSDTHQFGTRAYAPPEQFGYGQTDERSDIYALGMILYYCLTERTPDAQAREASWHDGRIPEPLRAVIEQAASFDPRSDTAAQPN
ncbi:MAG: protein kinase [Eggerthellaceae bacterium]|nr:protein kinase [Eggerthellaceae bacterium]